MERVKKDANLEIEILSGDEEANLIFSNYFAQKLSGDASYLYIDVGGGSTEVTLIRNGKKVRGKSFELGTVRILSNAVEENTWEKARKWIENVMAEAESVTAIGTGGQY